MSTTSSSTRKRPALSPEQKSSPKKSRWDIQGGKGNSNGGNTTSDSPLVALTDLKEQLKCALCLELLVEPKTLSCLHTFCEQCILSVVASERRLKIVKCPLCRENVDIPRGGFRTNALIKSK